MFHNLHSAYRVKFNYISKGKILHFFFFKTVVKTCENDLSNKILFAKVKAKFYING